MATREGRGTPLPSHSVLNCIVCGYERTIWMLPVGSCDLWVVSVACTQVLEIVRISHLVSETIICIDFGAFSRFLL